MPFKILTAPRDLSLPIINRGGRGAYLGGAFPAYPDPAVEAVVFVQKRCPTFPLFVQPAVAAGVTRACAEGLRTGKRLCSVRLEPDLLKYHDVDTTEEGAERLAYYFVLRQLWEAASPIAAALTWKTAEVLDVARGFGVSSCPGHLPVLADALEEAGCNELLVLRHLRECADHGGSCWVVDLLLAKE